MTRPYFVHSPRPSHVIERGAPRRDTADSPAPLVPQSKGFDGLMALVRRRELPAAEASKFGASPRFGPSALSERRLVGDREMRTRSVPVLPLPTLSVVKTVVSVVSGLPAIVMVPSRMLMYGRTTARTPADVPSDQIDNEGAVERTTFLELPPKRGLKLITHIKQGEFDIYSRELHRIMTGIEPLPVPEGPAPRDEASIALVRQGWRVNKLSPETAATFGVGSVPMQDGDAYQVGQATSYRRTSSIGSMIPVVGQRTVFSGVTTQILFFAPSEARPEGRAVVTEIGFRQYAPRTGYKVKMRWPQWMRRATNEQ